MGRRLRTTLNLCIVAYAVLLPKNLISRLDSELDSVFPAQQLSAVFADVPAWGRLKGLSSEGTRVLTAVEAGGCGGLVCTLTCGSFSRRPAYWDRTSRSRVHQPRVKTNQTDR